MADPLPFSVPSPQLPGGKSTLEKAINDFEEAAVNWSYKGAHAPSEHDYLEACYNYAKLRLRLLIGTAANTLRNHARLAGYKTVVDAGYSGPTDEERGG